MWLKAVVAEVVVLELLWVETSLGDDSEQLERLFLDACRKTMAEVQRAERSFCEMAYGAFLRSFQGYSSEDMQRPVTDMFYLGYLQITMFPPRIENSALFHTRLPTHLIARLAEQDTGIDSLANIYPSKIIIALRGDMGEGVYQWCSNRAGELFINGHCDRNRTTERRFWNEASMLMAETVIGNAFFLTTNGLFNENMDFYMYELKFLLESDNLCNIITVLNIVKPDAPDGHTCLKSRNLKYLRTLMEDKLAYRCIDVYKEPEWEWRGVVACLQVILKPIMIGWCSY